MFLTVLRSSYQNSYLVLVPGTNYEYEQKNGAGTKYEYEAKKSEKYEVRGLSTSSYLVLIGKLKKYI